MRSICKECGKNSEIIVNYDLKDKDKVCNICKDESDEIIKIRT